MVPSTFLEKIVSEDRPKGPAGWTASESQKRGARRQELAQQKEFYKWLKFKDLEFYNPRSDTKSTIRKGAADFSVFGPGAKTIFFEFKAPGCKQSPDQIDFMNHIRLNGFHYHVVYSAVEAIALSREFFKV